MLIKGQKVRITHSDKRKDFFKLGQIVEVHTPDKYGAWLAGEDKTGKFRDWYYEYHEFEVIDSIVESVIDKFKQRSQVGIKKYNTTLDRTDLNIDDWINHLTEELMDGILYLTKLKKQLDENNSRSK